MAVMQQALPLFTSDNCITSSICDASANGLFSGPLELQPLVPGHTSLERCCQQRDERVVVVVDLSDGLAGCWAHDSPGALEQESIEGDRRREEQGVQGRCVEPFADERCRAHHQDSVPG